MVKHEAIKNRQHQRSSNYHHRHPHERKRRRGSAAKLNKCIFFCIFCTLIIINGKFLSSFQHRLAGMMMSNNDHKCKFHQFRSSKSNLFLSWFPSVKPTTGVAVLGMHRSGTSMLAGLLVKGFGYEVGSPLFPPRRENKLGFFELISVAKQNDRFMRGQGMNWAKGLETYNAEMALEQSLESCSVSFDAGADALKFLNDKKNTPWLQKDPRFVEQFILLDTNCCKITQTCSSFYFCVFFLTKRMCITLQSWLPLLNTKPAILFTYRHPLDVANSLKKRNSISLIHGLKLWMIYNKGAIQNSRDLCRVYTSNTLLLKQPLDETKRIVKELSKKCNVPLPPKEITSSILEKFVKPSLQHSNTSEEDVDIIKTFNGGKCVVKDIPLRTDSKNGGKPNTTGSKSNEQPQKQEKDEHEKLMKVYLEAMEIYCDMESGEAYKDTYVWPNEL